MRNWKLMISFTSPPKLSYTVEIDQWTWWQELEHVFVGGQPLDRLKRQSLCKIKNKLNIYLCYAVVTTTLGRGRKNQLCDSVARIKLGSQQNRDVVKWIQQSETLSLVLEIRQRKKKNILITFLKKNCAIWCILYIEENNFHPRLLMHASYIWKIKLTWFLDVIPIEPAWSK